MMQWGFPPHFASRREVAIYLFFQEREEFRACARVLFETTEETRCFHHRILLFHAAHHHAEMFCFHDNADATRLQTFHERVGDLDRELFLDLQSTSENIDNARDFGQANNFSVRNVSDVCSTDEWQQVVLTHRIKLDVFDENDLAGVGSEDRFVYDLVEVLPVTVG